MAHEGLTTGRAAAYLKVHVRTLQKWDRTGIIPGHRTSTGRRYFLKPDLDAYLGRTTATQARIPIVYCRVSSQAQRPDLKNQRAVLEDFCISRGIANAEFIEEIGGGLNFKRPRFLDLIDRILAGEVEKLILAHNDRLARFGFDLIKHLCAAHDCEVLVLNTEKLSPEQEMVQDLMAITHCFSARLYGLRNYRKALKAALK